MKMDDTNTQDKIQYVHKYYLHFENKDDNYFHPYPRLRVLNAKSLLSHIGVTGASEI